MFHVTTVDDITANRYPYITTLVGEGGERPCRLRRMSSSSAGDTRPSSPGIWCG
jgi:hypothetical protein